MFIYSLTLLKGEKSIIDGMLDMIDLYQDDWLAIVLYSYTPMRMVEYPREMGMGNFSLTRYVSGIDGNVILGRARSG